MGKIEVFAEILTKMSQMDSPYSSSNAYFHDDYDLEEDKYDNDDDREEDDIQEQSNEGKEIEGLSGVQKETAVLQAAVCFRTYCSTENVRSVVIAWTKRDFYHLVDTEEASETEITQNDEPYEIKEQMYQDKLASLKKRLQQLKDGSHHEYNRKVRKLEYLYKERIRLNLAYRDYLMECVDRDYVKEKKAAVKEFEEKKIDLRENLLSDYEDKRRTIEAERYSLELTGDSMEVKPVMTRKLRRRPNDPIPVPEKRRKAPSAQVTYLLEEKEIEADLKSLQQRGISKPLTPVRKPGI